MGWLRQLNEDYWQSEEIDRLDAKLQAQQQASEPPSDFGDDMLAPPDAAAERIKALELDLGRMTLVVQALIEACARKGVLAHYELSSIIDQVDLANSSSQWGVAALDRPVISPPNGAGTPVIPNHIHDWAQMAKSHEGMVAPAIGVGGDAFTTSDYSDDDFAADEAALEEPTEVEGGVAAPAFDPAEEDFFGEPIADAAIAEPDSSTGEVDFGFQETVSDPHHFGDVLHHDAGEASAPATSLNTSGPPKRRRKQSSAVRQIIGVFGGGAIGLSIGYLILMWIGGPEKDFLEVAKYLPKWMLPASFSTTASSTSMADMKNPLKPDPNASKFKIGGSDPTTQTTQRPVDGEKPFSLDDNLPEPKTDLADTEPGLTDPLANPDDGIPEVKSPLDNPEEEEMEKDPGIEEPGTEEPTNEETTAEEKTPGVGEEDPLTTEPKPETTDDEPATSDTTPDTETPEDDPAKEPTTEESKPAEEEKDPAKEPTEVATADPAKEPPMDVEAAAEAPAGGPAVSVADFEKALETANLSVDAVVQGSLADAATKKAKLEGYTKFCALAHAINSVKADDAEAIAPKQQSAIGIATEAVHLPALFADVQTLARSWLKHKARPTPGILLAGKVTEIRPAGARTAVVIDLGKDITTTVVTVGEPDLAAGDTAVVLGVLVDDPATKLAGFEGAEKQAVWSTNLSKIELGME